MRVRPPHRNLDREVQVIERHNTGDLDRALDRRRNILHSYVEFEQGVSHMRTVSQSTRIVGAPGV